MRSGPAKNSTRAVQRLAEAMFANAKSHIHPTRWVDQRQAASDGVPSLDPMGMLRKLKTNCVHGRCIIGNVGGLDQFFLGHFAAEITD